MPIINLPDIDITERALTAWEGAGHDPNGLLALAQGEIVSEFMLGTEEPVVDDVTTIFFHTFETVGGRYEFILSPTGDGRLSLDLCERTEMDGPTTGPLAGMRVTIPKDLP